jgi:DNA-binding FadR family transcriptional regulator
MVTRSSGSNDSIGSAEIRPQGLVVAERGKLHVSVVEYFEREILSGRLKVGDHLASESELARSFRVSTRSIREALQILETKGLVRRKHGELATVVRDDIGEFIGTLAATVKQLFSTDPRYLVQLMDVRRMIELEVVGRLAAEGGRTSDEAEQALDGMRSAMEANDFARFTLHDAKFHLGLVHSVDNEILHVFYENLFSLITDIIKVASRVPRKSLDVAFAEHSEIHRLIRVQDVEGARAAIARQIGGSTEYLKIAMTETMRAKTRDK